LGDRSVTRGRCSSASIRARPRARSAGRTAGEAEVADALRAARAAQRDWAALPLTERLAQVRGLREQIDARRFELAGVMSAETGKNRIEALAEVQECIDLITTYSDEIERHDGYRTELGALSGHEHNVSVFRPYGVFAMIASFNFPAALVWNMVLGGILTGNAVILNPLSKLPGRKRS
jgi:1-pyrroline-5-carboxylate dehydrogenase